MADLPAGSDDGALEIVINDATTPANKSTVKAASTAAVATDPSLVVALSPNSPLPTGTNSIGTVAITEADLVTTGTLGALNASVSVSMAGYNGAGFEISTGTLVSTLTPQVSMDGGTTWSATSFFNTATGLLAATLTTTNAMANTQLSIVVPGGVSNVRVIVTAYTSGSSTVSIRSTVASMQPVIDAPALAVLNTIATNTGAQATDFIVSGTIVALNGAVSVNGQGVYTVSVSITGTWVATLVAEGQLADNTWVSLPVYLVNNSLPYISGFSVSGNGTYLITGGGYQNIRIRASAYTSGTVAVALEGSLAQQTIFAGQLGTWTNTVTQATAANLNATVTQQTITKGTQGSTGVTTQDLKDAGRTYVTFTADAIAGVTSDTIVTFTLNKQGTTTASQTSYTITNGKTLRIQSISLGVQSGAGAGAWTRLKLRHNTAGATTATSALVYTVEHGTTNANAVAQGLSTPIPDGLEFYGNGTQSIGISHISSATTNVESITICGYEY